MKHKKIFFNNFFILIYGFGKSGVSSFEYLKDNNRCVIFDDSQNKISKKYKDLEINLKKLKKETFDYIVLSPGIDINNCKIKNYLKKNRSKIQKEFSGLEGKIFTSNINNKKAIVHEL